MDDVTAKQKVTRALILNYSDPVDIYEVPSDLCSNDEAFLYALSDGDFSIVDSILDKPLHLLYKFYIIKEAKKLNEARVNLVECQKMKK